MDFEDRVLACLCQARQEDKPLTLFEIVWNARDGAGPAMACQRAQRFLEQREQHLDPDEFKQGRYLLSQPSLCVGVPPIELKPFPRVFLSYRRSNARWCARLICDRLRRHFVDQAVFIDVDDIRAGAAFPESLKHEIEHSSVVVAIVSPGWIPHGIDSDDAPDWVLREVETAVTANVPIIPLLVDNASEADLKVVHDRGWLRDVHCMEVDAGSDFDTQMDRIVRSIEELLR